MKLKFAAVFSLFWLLATGSSEASTYNFVLNSSIGPAGGNGSFTVNGPVSSNGLATFTEGAGLASLVFSIEGNNFTLDDDLTKASVTFDNGALINVAYLGGLNGFKLDLGTLGLNYIFSDLINPGLSSIGTISASAGVSATPLPPSWSLMLIGLVGAGFMAFRRKNSLQLAAA